MGEICFARYAEEGDPEGAQWYRGQCVNVSGNLAGILFVDYGNMAVVKPEDILQAPADFYFICLTATIQLAGNFIESIQASI